MLKFLKNFFPSKSEKDINEIFPIVEKINQVYETLHSLADEELKNKTEEFREIIKKENQEIEEKIFELKSKLNIEESIHKYEEILNEIELTEKELFQNTQEILDEILPEAFAVVKETCRRLVGQKFFVREHTIQWNMIPYDVQLIGGIILHKGKISEMATGEGKTLVATFPLYLNALVGKGVHLITVNDYLARRDAEWMGKIFEFLGLKVGVITNELNQSQKRDAYNCDITYGTNNEFGFDYLRDNMVIDVKDLVQREHYYTIVDEVDSVLIDEARTPLIISGQVQREDHKFSEMKPKVEQLVNAQTRFINSIVNDAEKKLDETGILLFRAYKGFPKHKKLQKLLSEPENKILVKKTEMEFLRDQEKRMPEIIDELYYSVDEKNHIISLTEKGREFLAGVNKNMFLLPDVGTEISEIENLNLSDDEKQKKIDELNATYADRSDRIHTVSQLLKAYTLYEKDVEYVVQEEKVLIVDEFTGRILAGRRYSEGLHQAIEAKENVVVEKDTQTLATITLQNYFRMYKKLAGMTGTAETEAPEFFNIYKLDVVVIPTNKSITRNDIDDVIYRTKREKYNAVMKEIQEMREKNRPILVGTTSVEVSEILSRMLKRNGIPHNVLNAKQHQREAEIIAFAGNPSIVTIATNMAGRGTDIKLGSGVTESGGLHIIGTERHESRRIDRQLRGRAGRQGDAGSSKFFLSLEDDLMRLFGSERIANIMNRIGFEEGEVIQHPMITKSVTRAQKKVEENNFGIRKRLLEYDNVMNQQREIVYSRRKRVLLGEQLHEYLFELLENFIYKNVQKFYKDASLNELQNFFRSSLLVDVKFSADEFQKLGEDGIVEKIFIETKNFYFRKENIIGKEQMENILKFSALQVIDERWKEHLREIDDLKEGIHLRGYGQKDPLLEYKSESFRMFEELLNMIEDEIIAFVFRVFSTMKQTIILPKVKQIRNEEMNLTHLSSDGIGYKIDQSTNQEQQQIEKTKPVSVEEKVGRNELCHCESGKKYKHCHGK